jgi:hypothetical protein
VNNELKRAWKEFVLAIVEVLLGYFPGEHEYNHGVLGQGSLPLAREVCPGPPKCVPRALTTWQQRLVTHCSPVFPAERVHALCWLVRREEAEVKLEEE